jgi:hypothetical protein
MTATSTVISPWTDRWTQPTLKELLTSLGKPLARTVDKLIQKIDALEGVEHAITWYGPSWKWTIEFTLPGPQGHPRQPLAYLVPNLNGPLLSVPVSQTLRDRLDNKRLRRYIKDGLDSAKRSVDFYWATWTFSNAAETDLLLDLLQRKLKFLTHPQADN